MAAMPGKILEAPWPASLFVNLLLVIGTQINLNCCSVAEESDEICLELSLIRLEQAGCGFLQGLESAFWQWC